MQKLLIDSAATTNFEVARLVDNEIRVMPHEEILALAVARDSTRKPVGLLVPYTVSTTIARKPSIYLQEPVVSEELAEDSSYSPYLLGVVDGSLPDLLSPIRAHADQLNQEFLRERGAEFLEKLGGADAVQRRAKDRVHHRADFASMPESFRGPLLEETASEAEEFLLISPELDPTEGQLRYQFSRVLQVLGSAIAETMLPLWEASSLAKEAASKFPSRQHARDFYRTRSHWRKQVKRFCKQHALPFDKWGIGTPGQLLYDATNEFRRTQLGIVLRNWAGYAIITYPEERGTFVLRWIESALATCPRLFEIFEHTREQRNDDKVVKGSLSMPSDEYRSNIYEIWRAFGNGLREAEALET